MTMKLLSGISDRLLELVAPRAAAAAQDCQLIGCCDSEYAKYLCSGPSGGSVRCIYAFGTCRIGGGG
jgi:hypothetical protein